MSAYVQSYVSLGLLALAIFLNAMAANYKLTAVLLFIFAAPVSSLIILRKSRHSATLPLYILNGALMLLGLLLLLLPDVSDGSSLVWFIVFPPMLMYCLGLKHGTISFLIYFALLALLLLTPLNHFLAEPITPIHSVRFLFALLGAFAFAFGAELVRYNMERALKRTLSSLEMEALTDPLTGLGNRRDFHKHFSWVKAKSRRDNQHYAIAMLDLDHFKMINDTYGHDTGDKVLVHLTTVLGEHIRGTDNLFRWGGEEFLVLMPEASPAEARRAAERLRRCVETTPFSQNGITIFYTVSIGLYCGNADMSALDEPLNEADRNLYAAKAGGRNRVVG